MNNFLNPLLKNSRNLVTILLHKHHMTIAVNSNIP